MKILQLEMGEGGRKVYLSLLHADLLSWMEEHLEKEMRAMYTA